MAGNGGNSAAARLEHVGTAVELWQTQQRLTIGDGTSTQASTRPASLGLQQAEQLVFRLFRQAGRLGQCLENRHGQDQCG